MRTFLVFSGIVIGMLVALACGSATKSSFSAPDASAQVPTTCSQWQFKVVKVSVDSDGFVTYAADWPTGSVDLPAGLEPFAIEHGFVMLRRCADT